MTVAAAMDVRDWIYSLATIFIKKDGRTIEQIVVRMDGRAVRRSF